MSPEALVEIALIAICLAAGGVLKGATGAGAPLLAVPALAAFFDVRFAIVVMIIPNIATNLWQAFRFRDKLPERYFMLPLLAGGIFGIIAGTLVLKALDSAVLSLVAAVAILGYVVLRLGRPHWKLDMSRARLWALPAGAAAGLLQGSAGFSAPVSITFLNAIQMGREPFIAAISALFATFTIVQLVAIYLSGLLAPGDLWYSLFALLPVVLAMPAGAWIGRRLSPLALDRTVLGLLCVLAAKLMADSLS